MEILVGFGSLVVIPFLGILSLLKVRVFPYLAVFCAIWFFVGLLVVGGGITPIDKGDIVTREERQSWLALPSISFVQCLWLTGLGIGVPLLIITWLYENTKVSKLLKAIKAITTIAAFAGGLFSFIKLFIIPKLFS